MSKTSSISRNVSSRIFFPILHFFHHDSESYKHVMDN
jgi:hypothetical protein